MPKQINVGINGVVRTVKEVPICVNGVIKKAIKGVCGINGIVKEFFTPDLLVTREVLNQGTFVNCTPTYLTNQVNGTDGFQITGKANNKYGNNFYYDWSSWLRWDISLDLSKYKTIKWHAKQITTHGVASVYVTDGMKYHPDAGMGNYTTVYAMRTTWYTDLPTSWTEYSLDVSGISGVHVITFMGGFTDQSGSSSSSSAFCNIRFLT